jgi:predicted NACHT family NTPase/DNA-binding CsgD family transcriptional regulator
MLFTKDFLHDFAKRKATEQLSPQEWQVFWLLFGQGESRPAIALQLNISVDSVSTTLSGVYRKFSITGSGPVKKSRLQEKLTQDFAKSGNEKNTQEVDWVEEVRFACQQKIIHNYSEIRLLKGGSVNVDQLYIDLWLLNRLPQDVQVTKDTLLEEFDLRNDRLGLGERVKRVSGLELVQNNARLLILGKPGSGKTTFLKQLAVDWCNNRFQPKLIALFLELRQIRDDKWNLLSQLEKELRLQDREKLYSLLRDGRLLILMDAFDEIANDRLRRSARRQIDEIVREYPLNRFVLTCRTQILTSSSLESGFTAVEVADFNDEQVKGFVKKWFTFYEDSAISVEIQCGKFQGAIDNNPAFKELTVTPVLLSLMCLILKDEGNIPPQRSLLYERGIKLLLRDWNDTKNLDEWEVGEIIYRGLDVYEKEKLLIEISAKKFEDPTNFVLFEEEDLIHQISSLLEIKKKSDSRGVLYAVEAQHGFLVERADDLWSFSHLTFQEYFTTKWLLGLSPQQLTQKVANKRWQSVVRQIVVSQGQSDRLLRLIKQAIDQSLSDDFQIQRFLTWISEESTIYSDTQYAASTMRTFYFSIAKALDFSMDFSYAIEHAHELDLKLDPILSGDRSFILSLVRTQARHINNVRSLERNLLRLQVYKNTTSRVSLRRIHRLFKLSVKYASKVDVYLSNELENLSNILPDVSHENQIAFENWWNSNAGSWLSSIDEVILRYRSRSQDWQFSNVQNKKLLTYHDANKFLVNLIAIEDSTSVKLREQIKDNLLLPMEELIRKNPEQYA